MRKQSRKTNSDVQVQPHYTENLPPHTPIMLTIMRQQSNKHAGEARMKKMKILPKSTLITLKKLTYLRPLGFLLLKCLSNLIKQYFSGELIKSSHKMKSFFPFINIVSHSSQRQAIRNLHRQSNSQKCSPLDRARLGLVTTTKGSSTLLPVSHSRCLQEFEWSRCKQII